MSLKAFHIFFVVVSTLFMAGFAFWAIREYMSIGGSANLMLAFVGTTGTLALPIYGSWFLRKNKKVSYV